MSAFKEYTDFQGLYIEASHNDRTIVFKGSGIAIFNRKTDDTAVDEVNVTIEKEFQIEKGYECELHGGGAGSLARLSDII